MNDIIPEEEINSFKSKYLELLPSVHKFLTEIEKFIDRSPHEIDFSSMEKGINLHRNVIPMSVYESYTDDEIMLFDVLYYTGRAIRSCEVRLPIDPAERMIDVLKLCVLQIRRDHFEFGKPKNAEVNVYGKGASSVYDNIKATIDELKCHYI